ncbi:Tyrocidine synthase 3 [Enhygromyxa salina]|uniref:Tyrocidine synthase 3 n=1 Tax=Enhygromyxa salina TaxID=215803 RepID=A0A2S9YGI7_9BACT|nr:amino acid adenylation domain-containing protein [Enhygromyxa salina]PRQ04225.1 Tyrocidine synthase 3 [Enhygromyxa salina]
MSEAIDCGLLHGAFLAAAAAHPERPALEVEGETVSYSELREQALAIAAGLARHRSEEGPPLTATLVHRSAAGFAGILGALCSGHGYVPMLPNLPPARIVLMLRRSGARSLVVDAAGQGVLDEVLDAAPQPLLVVLSEGEADEALRARHPRHSLIGRRELDGAAAAWVAPAVGADDIAYLLFTSGSTGEPKGVMVAHRNIARFLDVVVERYSLCETDRFSHLFEITFDLSLFDLFAAWKVGGCLCVPNAKQRLLPTKYVLDSKLSVWFSVPSAALLMKQMRALAPGAFPDLRLVLFCGEALPVSLASAFAEAAPNAVLENIYGPTELTLACTHYRWTAASVGECENEVVPIGDPFVGMRAKVVDEGLAEVAPGETGELLMTGPQRALGYWNDPERTAAAFMVPPGETELFYRTGDRVRRPKGDAPMTFLGRVDSQIKIHGYRVELGEIEAVMQREGGVDAAVALGWPKAPGGAKGVVGFIAQQGVDIDALIERMEELLPRYMVPRDIEVLDEFPLNQNGKIDRKALAARLDAAEDC